MKKFATVLLAAALLTGMASAVVGGPDAGENGDVTITDNHPAENASENATQSGLMQDVSERTPSLDFITEKTPDFTSIGERVTGMLGIFGDEEMDEPQPEDETENGEE